MTLRDEVDMCEIPELINIKLRSQTQVSLSPKFFFLTTKLYALSCKYPQMTKAIYHLLLHHCFSSLLPVTLYNLHFSPSCIFNFILLESTKVFLIEKKKDRVHISSYNLSSLKSVIFIFLINKITGDSNPGRFKGNKWYPRKQLAVRGNIIVTLPISFKWELMVPPVQWASDYLGFHYLTTHNAGSKFHSLRICEIWR